jgi:multiple sugar transport system substrate-binding protein
MRWMRAGVVAAAAAAVLISGCTSSGSVASSGSSSSSGTITLWARDSEKGFMSELAALYNKSHTTQVQVTIIPAQNFVQKFGTAAASDAAPDVVSLDEVFGPYFASVGALSDITSLYDSLPYKDQFISSHVAQSTWNGRVYALPFSAEASVLYYNKDLFTRAGLDPNKPPTSYAEIMADAKKIRALGPDYYGFTFGGACGGCNVFEFTPQIWASGGNVLADNGKKVTFDTPQVTAALTFYHQMWTAGVIPEAAKTDTGTQQVPLFTSGKVGMTMLGAFAIPSVQAAKVNFGVAPIPGETSGYSSFAGGDIIAIPSGSKHKTAAEDFIKWATGPDAQALLAHNGSIPIRNDLIASLWDSQGPLYKVFGQMVLIGQVPYSVVENAIFNDNDGPWVKMINSAVFSGNISGAVSAGQNAAQALVDGSS